MILGEEWDNIFRGALYKYSGILKGKERVSIGGGDNKLLKICGWYVILADATVTTQNILQKLEVKWNGMVWK